jgi:signal transduction histidine kinase
VPKINTVIFVMLLFIPFLLFSQVKNVNDLLNLESKKISIEYKEYVYFNKAQYHFEFKNWDSTLVYSLKQLNVNRNRELVDYCHYFRGFSFSKKKLFEKSKSELKLVSKKFLFYPLVNKKLGEISLELKEFAKAIDYFKAIEKLPATNQQGYKISVIYQNLGICYLHLNQFANSEKYFFKSKELQEKEKDTISLIGLNMDIAGLYYQQYKDKQAIPYFERAYQLSKKIKDFDKKEDASFNMAVVEENRGNYKQALAYRKESEQWKDSLNNQNKVWAVADFEKKFAIAQKQKQIGVLKVANKLKNQQRNGLFFAALLLLGTLIAGVYAYGQKVKNAKIILLQKQKLDQLNATKDQLFSIVSHDLRSSVNALKTSNAKLTHSLETKNYTALDQLLHTNSAIANGAYSLLDNLLHWAMLQTQQLYFSKESVHLHSIIQQIEYNYKPLLQDKNITFENAVAKSIFIWADLDSLKIILRNLLDNAIKFSPENSTISVCTPTPLERAGEGITLIVQDTGIGMSQNTIDELLKDSELLAKKSNSEIIGTGLGMQLCKQMIAKNDGTISIESKLGVGTKMILGLVRTRS